MITKPTPATNMAMGLPLNVAIARIEACAASLNASAEKMPDRSQTSFGQLIAAAVKRRTRKRDKAEDEPESFRSKIKAAVQRRIAGRQRFR